MKKLTIGSAVYDDFDGVYFSYQSIRLNNQDILDDLDLLIIDNNPESAQGKATKDFCKKSNHIRYIPYTEKKSTAVRNEIFNNAKGKFCMSIDCHVLFEPDTIKKLIKYFEENPETKDLFHGPMLYDMIKGHAPCTHMDPVWRDNMFGIWGYDEKGNKPENPPFEISMHGLGIFACKTDEWLGFNKDFIGFGGEEGYIHKKYEKNGRKIWCIPFLRWLHRFDRPAGVKYPLVLVDRIRNYIIGYKELGLPLDEIKNHFKKNITSKKFEELVSGSTTVAPSQNTPPKNIQPKKANHGPVKVDPNMAISPLHGLQKDIKMWSQTQVEFSGNASFRYIKYEINKSAGGHSCLSQILINPRPKNAKVVFCNSEESSHPASNLLDSEKAWSSNVSDQFKYPHTFIIDLQEVTKLDNITTFSAPGLMSKFPTEMKIYASKDSMHWEEVSSLDFDDS